MQKTSFLFLFWTVPVFLMSQGVREGYFMQGKQSGQDLTGKIQEAVQRGFTDTATAADWFKQIIKEAESKGDHYTGGMAYYEMGEMHSRYGEHNKAFGGYYNARPLLAKTKAKKEQLYNLFGLARESYYRGAFNGAANHLNYTITGARELGLKQLEADAMEYLAMMYIEMPYFDIKTKRSPAPDLVRSLAIKKELGDEKGQALILPKIAKQYMEEKRYDSASYYLSEGIALAKKLNQSEALISMRLLKVDFMISQKQMQDVGAELNEIRREVSLSKNPNLLVRLQTMEAVYLLSTGFEAAAVDKLDSVVHDVRRRDSPELLFILYKKMAEVYARTGNHKKAYEFQKDYNHLFNILYSPYNASRFDASSFLISENLAKEEVKYLTIDNELKQLRLLREMELRLGLQRENNLMDSLIRQEKNLNEALASASLGLERENKYKGVQLENEKKLRITEAARRKEQQRLQWTLLAAFGIAICMGAVIFVQYKRQRKKNQIIEKQSGDLQNLMKEIHHRVKNNLQVVSSLLNLQSHYIHDPEAIDAVKDSRNRVLSMALIHQSLYQEDDFRSIDAGDYIGKICNSLIASYNSIPGRITLVKDIRPLMLNADILMPIGLIVNELVTNSLKYAFPGKREGEVTVILKEEDQVLKLRVYDNGIGISNTISPAGQSSFGFKMIHSFLQKLKGQMKVYADGGTRTEIDIHHYK